MTCISATPWLAWQGHRGVRSRRVSDQFLHLRVACEGFTGPVQTNTDCAGSETEDYREFGGGHPLPLDEFDKFPIGGAKAPQGRPHHMRHSIFERGALPVGNCGEVSQDTAITSVASGSGEKQSSSGAEEPSPAKRR